MRKEERRQGRKEDQRAPFQTGLRHHQKNPEAEGGLHAREVRPSWVQGRQVQPYSALQSPLFPLVQAVPAVLQKAARLRQVTIWWEHIKFQFPRTVEQLWVATVLCGNCVATVWQLCVNCVATLWQLCGNQLCSTACAAFILSLRHGVVRAVPTQRCSKSSGGRDPTSVPPRQSKPVQEHEGAARAGAGFMCIARACCLDVHGAYNHAADVRKGAAPPRPPIGGPGVLGGLGPPPGPPRPPGAPPMGPPPKPVRCPVIDGVFACDRWRVSTGMVPPQSHIM